MSTNLKEGLLGEWMKGPRCTRDTGWEPLDFRGCYNAKFYIGFSISSVSETNEAQ